MNVGRQRRTWRFRGHGRYTLVAVVGLLALLASGCAQTSISHGGSTARHPGATASPTHQPSPTDAAATASPSNPLTTDPITCTAGVTPPDDVATSYLRAGDLLLETDQATFFFTNTVQVPDGVPAAPLKEPDAPGKSPTQWNWPVNPGDLVFTLCNVSASRSHTLQSVNLRISAATPYGGQLGVWDRCDTVYEPPRVDGHVCGDSGWQGPGLYFNAAYDAGASVGTTISLTQDTATYHDVPLPLILPPGRGVSLGIIVNKYPQPGTYHFVLGAVFDGQASVSLPETRGILFAPVARTWDGNACTTPAMQAQIPPPTNPPTYYICPKSS